VAMAWKRVGGDDLGFLEVRVAARKVGRLLDCAASKRARPWLAAGEATSEVQILGAIPRVDNGYFGAD
jgi:hypothetical protein